MSTKKLIIVTSVYPPEVGGPGVYFASLKKMMEGQGWDVEVMVRPLVNFSTSSKNNLLLIPRGSIVLVHATPKLLLPLMLVKLLKGIKIVARVGGDYFWERAVEREKFWGTLRDFYQQSFQFSVFSFQDRLIFLLFGMVLRKADSLVFTSPLLRDIYVLLFKIDKKKVHTITHPITEVRSTKYEVRIDQKKLQTANCKLLYAGRFLKLKNLDLLLEVFAEARKKHPQLTLTLIGEGPEEEKLKVKSKKLKVEDSVWFKKPVERDKVMEEMAQSDLVVLPSLSEVSPNLMLDALAVGTPMLVTQENGYHDVLGDAATWFNPMSKEDFLAKLESLLVPGALEKAREKVKTCAYRKTWEEAAGEYEDVLKLL